MKHRSKWVILLIGWLAGPPVPAADAADSVRVLATGVFATSLRDLEVPFQAASGARLQVTIANAGGVYTLLTGGEPADVVMTSAAGLEALARKGRVNVGSRIDIGLMRLGIGVRAGAPLPDVSSPEQLRALFLAAHGVAYIDPHGGATAGAFSEKVLTSLGIADAVHKKAILCTDGAEVVAALVAQKAGAGLTQASELQGAPGVDFAGYLPDALNATTLYAAAATAPAPSPATIAFLQFMRGPLATERLRRAGWDPIKP